MTDNVRGIRQDEFDKCLDLWDRSFEKTPRDYFKKYFYGDPWFDPEYTRVYAENGELLSCVQIVRRVVRVGKARLVMGGIANVGTPPEYRGRGCSTECLKSSITVMESDGFDFSILYTGINPFYARFDWVTLPIEHTIGDIRTPLPEPRNSYSVRDYRPEADAPAVLEVYDALNQDVVLSAERNIDYWNGFCREVLHDIRVAESRDGQVVGYVSRNSYGGLPAAGEIGCLLEHKDCVMSLLTDLGRRVLESGGAKLAAPVVEADPIAAALDRILVEKQTATSRGGMFRIIDLQSIFRKMLVEFSERVREAGVSGSIALETEVGKIGLRASDGSVEMIDCGVCDERVQLSQVDLCRHLFGLCEPEGSGLFRALFPKRPSVYWLADHF